MSESLTTGWAEPEVMEHYRELVRGVAEKKLQNHAGAAKAWDVANPEQAAIALYRLTDTDDSKTKIAADLGIPRIVLDRFIYHHEETWEKRRPMLAAQLTQAAGTLARAMQRKADMLLEDDALLAETPLNHLAIAAGVSIDKAAALNGMATTVVEHRVGVSLDDAMAAITAAKEKVKAKAIEAEIVE